MLHDGFRPLTGINFNSADGTIIKTAIAFLSPHGDKFQREDWEKVISDMEFPSPHGDKFQLQAGKD